VILIHNYFQYAGHIAAKISRKRKLPYFIFPHASLKKQSIFSSNALLKLIYLILFDYNNYKKASCIFYNAVEELDDSLFNDNGYVLNNGINYNDINCFSSKFNFRKKYNLSDKIIFLFLGRLDINQKAIDIILHSYKIFLKTQKSHLFQLVIAGPTDSSDFYKIKLLIDKLGLRDCVVFTGLVTGDEKKELLNASNIFLMPSRYEGLSISLLEAMGTGLVPIVSNRCGLHKSILEHNCGIVIEPSITQLVDAMHKLLDKNIYNKFSINSKNLIRIHYDWKVISNKLNNFLKSKSCYLND
jgi:glycosyltransferase involved in cell wall biosynthesis